MANNLMNRLVKLEKTTMPPQFPRVLRTFSDQHGLDGEMIRPETDEEVIQKHLAAHPEDIGLQFEIMNIVWVSSKNKDSGSN